MKKPKKFMNTPTSIKMRKRAFSDLIIGLFIVSLLTIITTVSDMELVENLYQFTRSHEDWELDEIIFAFFWLAIVATVYGLRRITDIKALNREIAYSAYYDTLTGQPNRNFAMSYLEDMLEKARANNSELAVIFLDFDNFKDVNDTYGHDVGDALIKQVSDRLSECIYDTGMLARIGGDEFLIIIESLRQSRELTHLIDSIQQCQHRHFDLAGRSLTTNFSIGVALFPSNATSSKDLLIAADAAMYQAKRSGTGQVRYYTSELDQQFAHEH